MIKSSAMPLMLVLMLTACASGDHFAKTDPGDPTWRLNEGLWDGNMNALLSVPPYGGNSAR
jgi:hypothetical protein